MLGSVFFCFNNKSESIKFDAEGSVESKVTFCRLLIIYNKFIIYQFSKLFD
jgi:hypothetical protein